MEFMLMSEITDLTDSIESLSFREKLHRKYKVKEKVETLPTFEKCLLLLCGNIHRCYDLKTHEKYKLIRCKQYELLQNNKITIPKRDILDFSKREISRLIYAIRLLNDYDVRDRILENKLISMLRDSSTKVEIINTNLYRKL
jgi:hypothetical protein